MSEQRPLLPVRTPDHNNVGGKRDATTWSAKTANLLESRRLHITVVILIAIDATCVLVDLAYTVLYPSCGSPDDMPMWLEILAHVSLTITSLFLVEIPMTLWAFGGSYFNPFGPVIHAGLHLFDALIIVTTFVFEVVLKGRERELAGLLIILRLWRLIKLVGGIAVGAGELGEEEARQLAEVREELAKTKTDLSELRFENQTIRQRLAMLEGH